MQLKLNFPLAVLALPALLFGCSNLGGTDLYPDRVLDAFAQGPQPLPVRVPLVPVSGATAQGMEEFLVPRWLSPISGELALGLLSDLYAAK